jgi:hypothetical protein
MTFKSYITILCVLVFCVSGTVLFAETSTPYLGVLLSQEPLPELLVKHLQLEPNRGVLIQNILIDGPADKASLDKDDIIVEFNGQPMGDYRELSTVIRASEVSQTAMLGVIQSGTLRQVTVQLEVRTPDRPADNKWKYPPELLSSHIWRPGRVFRLDPNQIPLISWAFGGSFPHDLIEGLSASHIYQYQHGSGEDEFTVTIKGKPEQADTKISVKAGQDAYSATVGTIDEIPEKFRSAVLEDIEEAKSFGTKVISSEEIDFPWPEGLVGVPGGGMGGGGFLMSGDIDDCEDDWGFDDDIEEQIVITLQKRLDDMEERLQKQIEQLEKMLTKALNQ